MLALIIFMIFFIGSVIIFFSLWSIYTIIKTKVPWAKTPRENLNKIFSEINLPKNSLIYDLGCGDGRTLFLAEKMGYRAVGYELSLYPFLKGALKKIIAKSEIKIKRRNFFKDNLKKADLVFIFLVSAVMEKLGRKLKKELKPGTIVMSYGFKIPDWNADKILDTKPSKTYFYKV
jgi:SAM-dependent methyltransferase